jgi:ketosteroid isomerase-like protein
MAETHAETVRANNAAFSRQDVDGMLRLFAPGAVVIDRRPMGWSEYRGHTALRAYYQGLFDNAAELSETLEIVAHDGDLVIADCHTSATLAGSPEAGAIEFAYALAIAFTGDLIDTLEIYPDAASARADKRLA